MRLVVCDDDANLRSVVSRLAEEHGLTVIAETDNAADAVELIARFGAGVLVLDLSLPWGSGTEALQRIRAQAVPCQVIVFTSYREELPRGAESVVRAVIEKPDFDSLAQVFADLAAGVAPSVSGLDHERRKPQRERPNMPPAVVRSPSGIEDPETFAGVLLVLEPGDAVLYVHVAAPDDALDEWGRLLHTDRFLAVGRAMRSVLRIYDRLSVEGDELVAALLDSDRGGVESLWERLQDAHLRAGTGGVISGGWAVVDEQEPAYAAQAHARDAVRRSVGQPPGDRLWAG